MHQRINRVCHHRQENNVSEVRFTLGEKVWRATSPLLALDLFFPSSPSSDVAQPVILFFEVQEVICKIIINTLMLPYKNNTLKLTTF